MGKHEESDDLPDPYSLADEHDDRDWDVALHGRMRDHAAPDDAVQTIPWQE